MKKGKGTFGWVFTFAGQKKSGYIASVIFAVIGAAFQILPFFVMARVIGKLLSGDRDLAGFLIDCAVMAAFWLLRTLFHSLSTAQSHKATFAVLGNIRKQGLAKLAKMPLGDVQSRGSGELKNILVERVDSIEPTLAHAIPEMSSNAAVALATLIYLFVIDWRMALASLITFPLGMVFFMLMMAGYEKNYARTVTATNTLNDTAVEYIGGIEVIKVFGKAKSSYEKFVSAAKECARSYIDWMNKSNFYFTFAMNIMPSTLLSVLPSDAVIRAAHRRAAAEKRNADAGEIHSHCYSFYGTDHARHRLHEVHRRSGQGGHHHRSGDGHSDCSGTVPPQNGHRGTAGQHRGTA